MEKKLKKLTENRIKNYLNKLDKQLSKLKDKNPNICSSCGEEYLPGYKCCHGEWL